MEENSYYNFLNAKLTETKCQQLLREEFAIVNIEVTAPTGVKRFKRDLSVNFFTKLGTLGIRENHFIDPIYNHRPITVAVSPVLYVNVNLKAESMNGKICSTSFIQNKIANLKICIYKSKKLSLLINAKLYVYRIRVF